jgi:uncharacterized membrane protein YqhA
LFRTIVRVVEIVMFILLILAAVVFGAGWLAQTLLALWSAIPKRNQDIEP